MAGGAGVVWKIRGHWRALTIATRKALTIGMATERREVENSI